MDTAFSFGTKSIVKLNRSQYIECAKNSLEFRGYIGQLTKAKLAEGWGVDRTSAVFLRVHGYTPLLYLCGTGMDTFS